MEQFFTIETVVKQSNSPCIITLNGRFQLIGDNARALEEYMRPGMKCAAVGYTRGKDFLIERLTFTDGVVKGLQVNRYV